MGRRRRKKKSTKIPWPVETMINLAGGAAMGVVAAHMESKYHYTDKGKPNPYAVTAAGFATGNIRGTRDIVRLGAIMGAMGAFDPEHDNDISHKYISGSADSGNYNVADSDLEDAVYQSSPRNKYAWRLNCEDGSKFGIHPEDYETREEYHEALHQEKYAWRDDCEDGSEFDIDPEAYETEDEYAEAIEDAQASVCDENAEENPPHLDMPNSPIAPPTSSVPMVQEQATDLFEDDDFHVFIFCKVETSEGIDYYRTEDRSIRKGDNVLVPSNLRIIEGTVISIEHHMRFSVPKNLQDTRMIIEVV